MLLQNHYFNLNTGEVFKSNRPAEELRKENCLPYLGDCNVDEHPYTEPGYRPTKILEFDKYDHIAWCEFENKKEGFSGKRGAMVNGNHDENFEAFVLLSNEDKKKIREYRKLHNLG